MFYLCIFFVCIIFSGSTLWTRILQCLHNPVVCPAADLPSWPHRCDARSPAAGSPHYAQHALQASDQLRQCWFRLHSYTTTGPAAVTPQGLRAQPQKARQLWGRMRVSGFNSAKVIYCETKLLPAPILISSCHVASQGWNNMILKGVHSRRMFQPFWFAIVRFVLLDISNVFEYMYWKSINKYIERERYTHSMLKIKTAALPYHGCLLQVGNSR